MHRILKISALVAVILAAVLLASADWVEHIYLVTSAPTGSCSPAQITIDTVGQALYVCPTGGTWGSALISNGGGGGSPGGSTTQIQYNNSSAFGGASGLTTDGTHLFQSGYTNMAAIATPSVPSASTVNVFGRSVAGRMMVAQQGPSGLDTALQSFIARNKITVWTPAGNSTTITAIGAAALSATGTATAANVATTTRYTYMRTLEYLVTVAATTAVAGFRNTVAQYALGASAGDGGFTFVCRWGPATGTSTSTNRAFVGMTSATGAPTDVNPSSLTNMFGVGWDNGDTNMQFFHNDGSGTATKTDLGSNFPHPTADRTKAYEVALFSAPNSGTVSYEVTDLATGNVATGSASSDLPAGTTLLAPRGWESVGGTSSVIGIGLMSLYIETDY